MHTACLRLAIGLSLFVVSSPLIAAESGPTATVTGQLKKWHTVTLTFDGPPTDEQAQPNPFTDYRLVVTFTHKSRQVAVPGYFAADGNAANTSATEGNKWRAHFVPDEEGTWRYVASFRHGKNIAIAPSPTAGQAIAFDGASGAFDVGPADPQAPGFLAKGMLRYVGKHHLQFAETKEYFLKGGADSPENFLAYTDFDGTRRVEGGEGPLHEYAAHVRHWHQGDPTWKDGKGKGIVGALNYLASQQINSVYFLTYNIDGGDGKDTWMWTGPTERWRFDCSKLDQWEIVFSHMDRQGIQLHVVTQEMENDEDLGGNSELNDIRKLYYRELVARFAHHRAVIWNLGEENGNTDQQRKAFAAYFRAHDPYDHPICMHCPYNLADHFFEGLLGYPNFEAISIQGNSTRYNTWAIEQRVQSARAGRKWCIYGDEQAPPVDKNMKNLDVLRKLALWGNLMGGGAGVEWYFSYQDEFGDLTCDDWTAAEPLWTMTRHALQFFQKHLPFAEMEPANELVSSGNLCLAKKGEVYVVYLLQGSTARLTLPPGKYQVLWFNPRTGGKLLKGQKLHLDQHGETLLGIPPQDLRKDWVALVRVAK